MFEKIITIFPAVQVGQSKFIEQCHKLGQNESQQQTLKKQEFNAYKRIKSFPV